jgi:hypothetical protein
MLQWIHEWNLHHYVNMFYWWFELIVAWKNSVTDFNFIVTVSKLTTLKVLTFNNTKTYSVAACWNAIISTTATLNYYSRQLVSWHGIIIFIAQNMNDCLEEYKVENMLQISSSLLFRKNVSHMSDIASSLILSVDASTWIVAVLMDVVPITHVLCYLLPTKLYWDDGE